MATRKQPKLIRRACGTMGAHMLLLERYPAFRARQQKLENETNRRRALGFTAAEIKLAKIKVVVNVVYKDPSQNISDAQINSQIKVLNLDFRAKNSDKKKTPAVWSGLVADSQIEFVLYKVTRTKTTQSSFGADGVVINYQAFGTMGTAQAPFNKGRTATHEIGHYLNLRHIWGDTEDCTGSDLVADTPNCAGPNFGKPAFPKVSCSNGPNGDMFVNYMDYVDDAAMFMFTPQQVARMRTALDGPRRTLW